MVNALTGSESPLQMSAVTSPVTSLGRSKSSSLRRRKRPGRQTSVEKHNGEVSTSASGKTKITACHLNMYVHCFCVFVFFHILEKRLSFFVLCQMVEEGHWEVVWNWRFVHAEVLTAGLSPPCCPLLSLCSCPASAEGTLWKHIRSVWQAGPKKMFLPA